MPLPLNPELYRQLQKAFGVIRITNPLIPMVSTYIKLPDGRLQMRPTITGETYFVNCPFCGDRKQRLCVNHRWGIFDPTTKRTNLWLAHCFNQDCLRGPHGPQHLDSLVTRVTWYHRRARAGQLPVAPPSNSGGLCLEPIPLPDDFIPVRRLPSTHCVRQFLRQCDFDHATIGRVWGIGSAKPYGYPRLMIPVRRNEGQGLSAWGWTSRRTLNSDRSPKYLTARGFHKSMFLYGEERVKRESSPVVVCEGPLDIWRLGPNAVAILGKTISGAQIDQLCKLVRNRPVVVALDSDAPQEMKRAVAAIAECRGTMVEDWSGTRYEDRKPGIVVGLALPDGGSPHDYPTDRLWAMVEEAVEQATVARSRS